MTFYRDWAVFVFVTLLLLHVIGFVFNPESYGRIAAEFMNAYEAKRN